MLRGLFEFDGGLMNFFAKFSDIVILNIVFVITCIPLITIGPALTAMYVVTMRMARSEDSYVVKSYFKAFKENFKISILAWLLILGVVGILVLDYRIATFWANDIGKVMQVIALVLLFLLFVVSLLLFPYIARFENTLRQSFKSAAFIAIAALPKTLLLVIITSVVIVFIAFLLPIPYAIFSGFLFVFSLLAFFQSLILKKIFGKYEDRMKD